MDALVTATHAATASTRPILREGDRVADAYQLRLTGTVRSVGLAYDSSGRPVPTARVRWDGEDVKLHDYAQDTLRLIYRESCGVVVLRIG